MNIQEMRDWIPSFEGIGREALFSSISSMGKKMAQVAKDCFTLIAYTASCLPKFFQDSFRHGVVYYARDEGMQNVLNALSRLGLISESLEDIDRQLTESVETNTRV